MQSEINTDANVHAYNDTYHVRTEYARVSVNQLHKIVLRNGTSSGEVIASNIMEYCRVTKSPSSVYASYGYISWMGADGRKGINDNIMYDVARRAGPAVSPTPPTPSNPIEYVSMFLFKFQPPLSDIWTYHIINPRWHIEGSDRDLGIECDVPVSVLTTNGWAGESAFHITAEWSGSGYMAWGTNGGASKGNMMTATRVERYYTSPTSPSVVRLVSNTGIRDLPSQISCSTPIRTESLCGQLNFTTLGGRGEVHISRGETVGTVKIGAKPITASPTPVLANRITGIGAAAVSYYELPVTVHSESVGRLSDLIRVEMIYK
jgi:hypothetical protein